MTKKDDRCDRWSHLAEQGRLHEVDGNGPEDKTALLIAGVVCAVIALACLAGLAGWL